MTHFNPLFDEVVICKSPGWGHKSHYLRKYVKPTETASLLAAQLDLARAAISARGRSLPDVWDAVRSQCSGFNKHGGETNKANRRRAAHAAADANVARMQERLARKGGGAPAPAGPGAPPPPPPGRYPGY